MSRITLPFPAPAQWFLPPEQVANPNTLCWWRFRLRIDPVMGVALVKRFNTNSILTATQVTYQFFENPSQQVVLDGSTIDRCRIIPRNNRGAIDLLMPAASSPTDSSFWVQLTAPGVVSHPYGPMAMHLDGSVIDFFVNPEVG